jgi:hypothetical protein
MAAILPARVAILNSAATPALAGKIRAAMKVTRQFARRFRLLTLLRAVLGLGGALHLATAAVLVAAPAALAASLGTAVPEEPVLRWLLAALLAPLAGVYLLAARDPRRYAGAIVVVIGGRALGALALGAGALARPDAGGLWTLAGVDLAFAVAIAAAWLPLRV